MAESILENDVEWMDLSKSISDNASERRRMQNRMAQRNHRARSRRQNQTHPQRKNSNSLVWKQPYTIPKPPAKVRDQKQQQQYPFDSAKPQAGYMPHSEPGSASPPHISLSTFEQPKLKVDCSSKLPNVDFNAEDGPTVPDGLQRVNSMLLSSISDLTEFLPNEVITAGQSPQQLPTPHCTISQEGFEPDFPIFDISGQLDKLEKNEAETNISTSAGSHISSRSIDMEFPIQIPPGETSSIEDTTGKPREATKVTQDRLNNDFDVDQNTDLEMELNEFDISNSDEFRGFNVLHLAAYNGQTNIVRLLLVSQRVDTNAVTGRGLTALHIAAESSQRVDAARELLDHGADLLLQDDQGRTALHVAVASGAHAIISLLVDRQGDSILHVRNLAGCTPLHEAVLQGREDIVRLLLARGADPGATVF